MQRIGDSLKGKRVLITQSEDFMGPALCEAFRFYDAEVIADPRPPITNTAVENIINNREIDILIANLIAPSITNVIEDTSDIDWLNQFRYMVDPLHRLSKKIVPKMKHKGHGKIVVMSSIAGLKNIPVPNAGSGYAAARGAQIAWTQSVGIELAECNIQVNAIAQGWIDNPFFYPESFKIQNKFKEHLSLIPANRLANADECTSLAVFLASSESNFFIGQCFPISGGWIN
jgi:2-keto-3-deoxy-L-fuconate dehydrogenase